MRYCNKRLADADQYVICLGLEIIKTNPDSIFGIGYYYNYRDIYFLQSTDKGESWKGRYIFGGSTYSAGGKNIWAADNINQQKIYIVSAYRDSQDYYLYHPSIFHSTDRGVTWNEKKAPGISSPFTSFSLALNQNGSLLMGFGESGFFRSTDSGDSWLKLSETPKNLCSIESSYSNPDLILLT